MSCRADNTRSIRRWAVVLLAGGLAATGSERPLGAQTPPLPTFPSQVELITVDAVVVDQGGRPVPGLTKDDFVIKEDGHLREIESFEAFVLEPSDVPVAPPAVASNEPAAHAANGRAFTILVDDVRITRDRTEVARSAVATFLERSVREGDLVTLRSSSGDLSWTARIPEGTEDLLAVLSRLRGRAVEDTGVDSMSEYEAFQIANREDLPGDSEGPSGPSGSLGRGTAPAQPGPGSGIAGAGLGTTKDRVKTRWENARWCVPAFCDSEIRAKAADIDAHRRTQLGVTLQALRRELRALALDRGRKSLLFLSDGFIEDYSSDLREVAADSRQANTAIYFLDLRGLVAKPGFGSASEYTPSALPDPREQAQMGFEASALAAAGAQTLADVTGGFSVRNTNDLAGGMERIAKESRMFYLLGFYPPEGKPGRAWRNLSVEVKRPGLIVRARRGYTLRAEAEPAPPVKKGKAAKTVADPVVARALDSAQELPGIPLRAMAYVLEPRPHDTVHVLVAAEIDADRLAVQHKANAAYAHLDVSVVTEDRDTGRGFRHDDVVDLPLRAGEPAGWRAFAREFELPAGVSQVHVVVRDLTSGAMGSVSQRFEVPLPGQLHLSTPILTDRVEPATSAEARPQLALAVHRVFPPRGGLYVEFEVFGAGRDPIQGQPRVTAGLELFASDGHLVRKLDPTPVAVDAAGRVVRQVGISLDGMEEGSYDVVLDVKDEVRGAGLKHRETFMLARDVASR